MLSPPPVHLFAQHVHLLLQYLEVLLAPTTGEAGGLTVTLETTLTLGILKDGEDGQGGGEATGGRVISFERREARLSEEPTASNVGIKNHSPLLLP
jgi:hypothetical protein